MLKVVVVPVPLAGTDPVPDHPVQAQVTPPTITVLYVTPLTLIAVVGKVQVTDWPEL